MSIGRRVLGATALSLGLAAPGCGDASSAAPPAVDPVELRPSNVDPQLVERAPASFASLMLPADAGHAFASVGAEGDAVVVVADGRFFAVDAYGGVAPIRRRPGDAVAAADAPVANVIERAPGDALALVPGGALRVRDGWVERAEFPPLLAGATARSAWGAESLWATPGGLFTTLGARWLRLDRAGGAVTDARAVIAAVDGRDAWVLAAGGALRRVRLEGTADAPTTRWSDPVPGLLLDHVKSIAVHRGLRYVARQGDLLRVNAAGAVERVRIPGTYAGPYAMASSGPWLWLVWDGDTEAAVARYDGDRTLEMLGRGGPWRAPALAVGGAHGDVAVVVDGAAATRVAVEAPLVVTGLVDGETVTEPAVAVRVDPPSPALADGVDFSLDGVRVASAPAAPFTWGPDGAALRQIPTLEFGEHVVTIAVRYRGAPTLRTTRRFVYASPLGRVPTYTADILPLYSESCARCHSTGIARDLSTFAALSAQARLVAAAVQSRRMPPDLTVDTPTIRLVSAWVAGGSRER